MTKKIFKSNFEMKSLNLNHIALRAVLMVLLVTCGVGEMWADPTYYYAKLTVQCKTGDGYVYAGKENTSDVQYGTGNSTDKIQTTTQNEAQTFFAWAMPGRGAEFAGWEKTSNINSLSGSSNPYTVTVKASSTDVTEGKLTATWTKYTKVNVTYNASEDGEYKVNYSYNSYDGITKTITAGDAEGLSCTINSENGNKTIGSYYNDVITLTSEKGTFQGWYSDAGFTNKLSDANPYTYVAPQSGTGSVYAKYPHVDKYYGRLKASIAEEPYSMPGGGMIFISKESAAAVEYSDEEQTVDNVGMGTTDLIYYLKAQPTDKRYVFRGWYSNPECTGTALSTNKEYTYTFTASSTNSASPTLGNIYAVFDFNLYYMQVEVEPAVPGLGMVLVKDNNTGTPDYTEYATNAEQFLFAYRLAPTANAYLYAKPKYGYKFSGWYDNPDCTGTAVGTANPLTYVATGTSTDPMNPTITKLYAKFVEDDSKVNITYNIPDKTKGEYTASVLDIAEVDDDFVWTFTKVYNSADYTANTTLSQNKTDVLRLEAQPKAGYGVTSWTIAGTAKTSPSHLYETTATAAATYGVTFGDAKPFLVSTNSTQYATLREALTAVGNSGKITVVQNAYVEAGNYTIPSGVTLLVPYESTGKSYTSPSEDYEKIQAFSKASQYVLLTLGSGVNMTLAGNLIIMSDLCAPSGGSMGSGAPQTAYGRIAMSENSTITVNSGANLYCWGYITGMEGLVTAKSGAKIHEIFQHQNNPGGSAASGWNDEAFFMNQYYVQNIESPLKIEYGATETVYAQITIPSSSIQNANTTLIGKDNTGMFALTSSGSYIIRTYNPSTDRITYDIYGNAKLNYITLSMYITIDTRNYVLPITNNMSVKCHTLNGAASALNIQYAISFLPGSELIIDEGVTLNVSDKLIIYDRDEWVGKTFAQFNKLDGGGDWSKSSFTPTRTYTRVKADLVDAKVDLNGTMNVSGSVYTTNSGAAIISSNGTGVVKLSSAAPGNSNDIQYSANKLGTSIKVPMTPAQLRNGDDSYTLTAGAVANDQFIYSKSQEKWLKNPKVVSWNANGGETEASTLAYSEGDFLGELPAAYKDGYTLEGWYTAADGGTQIEPTTKVTANITYYAHWTPKTYTISYRDNGGVAFSGTHVDSPNAHPTTHTFGTATTLNGVNNKTGYTFGGWYRTPSCSGTVVTSIAASECKNITLYAKWIPNTHKLTWNWDGGSTSSTTYTAAGDAVAYNTAIVYPEASTMTKTNFVFNGWDKSITTMPDEDLTITAQWEPAVTSVTAGSTTTYYTTFVDALTYAKTQATATITILDDITETSTALTYNKTSGTCTLDLNGKTVSLTVTASGNSANLFAINAANSTFTITDNSANKDGVLDITTSLKVTSASYHTRGIAIVDGALILDAGTVRLSNTYPYTKTSNSGMIKGINVAAGKSFTMNGGAVYAESPYYPRAINVEGSASANAIVNINNGTITAHSTTTTNAMGIYTIGGTLNVKPGVTINATTTTTSAYGIYVDASTNGYFGTLNMTGGTVNATGATGTAYGIFVNGVYVSNNTTPNTFGANYKAKATIAGGTFNVTTTSKTVAYGVCSRGTTTISGGDFTVAPATTTAIGVFAQDGTTTIEGNPTFDVSATETAYGIQAGNIPHEKTGQSYNGNVIVKGGTFDVQTRSKTTAYGVYVYAGTRNITSTESGYYPGHYVSAGKATIEGGTFNVTAKTYTACGVYVNRAVAYEAETNNAHVFRGEATINGGTFTIRDLAHATSSYACDGVRSYGTLNITGGSFDVAASAATAKNATYVYGVNVFDGTATISGNPEFTVSAYGTAFGAVANGATPDKATGLPCEADLTIDGGTFNVNTTTSTTAYGVYAAGFAPRVITSTDAGYYPGTYYSKPVATVNGGTFNVEAKTTTAIGAYCGRGVRYDPDVLEPHTVELESFGELNIKGGTFNVSTLGTTTADGVRSFGTTNITGGTFNVTPKTSTATAIRAYAGKTTITDNPHFTVKGTKTVYGLNAGCEAPNAKSGLTYNGEIECNGGTFDLETTTGATCYGVYAYAGSVKITTLHSADANYFAGNYASAGTIVVNDGIFNVKAKTTGAYGVVVPAAVSESGATGYPTATATAKCDINGGKFLVNGTEKYAVYKKATTANFKISGGYWGGDGVNDNLAYYAVSPNKVLTLRETHALYPDGYRYSVNEGGTVTWKNGSTTLKTEVYESGETPEYTGETPTKEATAEYTYEHNGWTPTIVAMENSDVTYSATFTPTLRQYDVTFNLQGHGDAITSQTKDYGSKVDKPTDPTADGWIFGGWFKEASCTNEWNFSTDYVQGTTELFAKWTMDGVGPKLDIVDWTSSTLTINMNGIPAAGWNYTIKVGELESHTYAKDDRDDDRTLTVDYKDEIHIPNPDTQLRIVVTKGNAEVYSSHNYIIPHVYSSGETLGTVNENSILVVNNGTLEIATSVKVNAIYVAPGAELKVDKSVTLTVDSLMLRTTPWEAAILDNQGTISSSKTYYTRKIADNTKYYQFAIPLASDVKNVRLSNNSKCTYNTSWMLKSYNEESRANNGAVNTETISNWDLLTTDGEGNATILGSVGYEMFSNTPYYREYYFPVKLPETEATEVGVSYHSGEAGPNHAGWNALCSPLMRKYPQAHGEPDERLKISLLNPDGTYQQTAPDIIYPAVPFYYQATHNGKIYFNSSAMVFNAPRRAWDAYVPTQWLQLTIRNENGDRLDETNIYTHPEKFSVYYETGYDVAKQSLTGGKALIYSELPCGKLAFAAVPDSLAENRIPITVNANEEGEFLFSLMENNYLGRLQHVLLHDTQNGLVIDLLERDYSAKLNAGTNAGRFYIQCVFAAEAPAVTTGVNSVESNDDAPQKIMYKNKVYIIYQGRVYDMTGRQCELR